MADSGGGDMRDEWLGQTGDSWAAEWRRTDRSFGPLTERLLLRTRDFTFARALDVGCGAGELSLALARGRHHVSVVGIDISSALIAVARERGKNLANLSFEAADAAQWAPAAEVAPDLLVSRHGVMFFQDPQAAFTHLAAVAAPTAGLLFSCFRSPAENPFFTEVGRLLPTQPPAEPDAPGPFAFADPSRVEGILSAAGWTSIEFEPFDFAMVAGAGEDPIADALQYYTRIGPAARALRELPEGERARVLERIAGLAERNRFDNIVSLRAAAWIVSARKG